MLKVRAEFLPTMGYLHNKPLSVDLKLEYIRIMWFAKMQILGPLLRVPCQNLIFKQESQEFLIEGFCWSSHKKQHCEYLFRMAFVIGSYNFHVILIWTQAIQRTDFRNHKHSKNSMDYKDKPLK